MTSAGQIQPFPSLAALRAAHADLLKTIRETRALPSTFGPITEFIARGVATGAILSNDDDRDTAQNLLDYWSALMFRSGQEPPDTTLTEFDDSIEPDIDDSLCPYIGLVPFTEEMRPYFFGRRGLLNDFLLKRLETTRLLALVSPAGGGKSSVLRAGILATLKQGSAREESLAGSEHWNYLPIITPGSDPLGQLARLMPSDPARVSQLLERPDLLAESIHASSDQPAVLLVDQFDELFTLNQDERVQEAFISALVALADTPGLRHTVLIGMRSDVESQIARFTVIQEWFRRGRIQLLPLSAAELREAIEKPAELVGLRFEAGLIDKLIEDLLGEPAALPLLQFTLLELWEHRERNLITWASYRNIGAGRVAIARCANDFYNNLPEEDRPAARRLLLRLVRIERGMDVALRRLPRSDLFQGLSEAARSEHILRVLEHERLVRVTRGENPADDQIELAHDALARHWPMMVDWLETERVSLETRRRLEARAAEWIKHGRGTTGLLDPVQLGEAEAWMNSAEARELGFDPVLQTLVSASRGAIEEQQRRELRQAEERARIEQQRAEAASQLAVAERQRAEAERQRAEQASRHRRRLGTALALIATMLFVAIGLAVYAFQQTNIAQEQQREAETIANELSTRTIQLEEARQISEDRAEDALQAREGAERKAAEADEARKEAERAKNEADEARKEAEQRAIEARAGELAARALATQYDYPQRALLLAIQSLTISISGSNTESSSIPLNILKSLLAVITGQGYYGHTAAVTDVLFDRSGGRLVTVGEDGKILIWGPAGLGKPITTLDAGNPILLAALSQDGRYLATAGEANDTLKLWDLNVQSPTAVDLLAPSGTITNLMISDNGQWLGVSSSGGGTTIYALSNPSGAARVLTTRSKVNSMQLSNDGRWAATAHEDGVTRLWNLSSANPSPITTRAIGSPATTVAFAPNTRWLAIGYRNGLTHLWSINNVGLAANAPSVFRGQTGEITHITFSPNSSLVATTSADDSTYLWEVVARLDPPSISVLRGHTARINDVVISPDNSKLITVSSDQTVRVWDLNASDPGRAWIELIGHDESVTAAAFSPDGRLLVTVSDDASLRVWNTTPKKDENPPEDPQQLIQQACQVVGRNFTQAELDELAIKPPPQPVCPSN
ncbi:MAG: hypothetical protein Fur005_44770 [Roseiflexaceae bacterium]